MRVSSVEIAVKRRQEGPGKIKSAKDKASYHSRHSATKYSPYSILESPVTCSTESEGEPIIYYIIESSDVRYYNKRLIYSSQRRLKDESVNHFEMQMPLL